LSIGRSAPEPTIARIALYLRCLRTAQFEGSQTLSSADIEARTGISSGQVRKDLSYFGEFGKPGLGYAVTPLLERLAGIMRLDKEQPVMIVGAGNLGTALAGYTGFQQADFKLVAIYDNNFSKIGRRVWDLEILDIERMPEINAEMGVQVGIIATPAASAKYVADRMAASGVKVILNFAPTRISVPKGVIVRNVDLTQELQILCYYLPETQFGELLPPHLGDGLQSLSGFRAGLRVLILQHGGQRRNGPLISQFAQRLYNRRVHVLVSLIIQRVNEHRHGGFVADIAQRRCGVASPFGIIVPQMWKQHRQGARIADACQR
jgi:redox-sensing transcriptional repressor